MTTVASIINDFGGPAKFGRAIGVPTEHAGSIKRRASIPVRYWPRLIEAAKEAGKPVTYEQLVAIHASDKEQVA